MGPGAKEDNKTPKGWSKSFTLGFIFLLKITNLVAPVTGFALRSCRISFQIAICTGNDPKLRAVPRDIPSTVQGFDLSTNSISRIQASDFKNLQLLTQLDLKNNKIAHIDTGAFADLISLRKLNLNSNKLGKLDDKLFDGLRNLTELRIHGNKINLVASSCFESLTSLTFLDISNNKMQTPANVRSVLQQLPNLRNLEIMSNNITTFQSWELTNGSLKLTSLDLSKNPIEVFRVTADVFPNLTRLNIAYNSKRHFIWDVRNKTFVRRVSSLDISSFWLSLEKMRTLLESFNSSLVTLKINKMKCNLTMLVSVSCAIPTMSKLQLQHNRLDFVHSNFFQLCSSVTELDLAHNNIQKIQESAFRSMPGLRILRLTNNKLTSVPTATINLHSLAELDLSKNKISKIECKDFANLTKLRQLNLYQNSISALKGCVFKDLVRLQVLKIQNNTISQLNDAFKMSLPNLRQLHLNSNKLTVIKSGEFQGLWSLQILSLHFNLIRSLNKGCFHGLKNLTDINLQSNNIEAKSLEEGSLNDLINLRNLNLRNNHIKYFTSSALLYPPFSNLSLLEKLAIPGQRRRGKFQLPSNILQGLTNLLDFSTRTCQLLSIPTDIFKYTPRLQNIDISSNDLTDLSPNLFSPVQNLKSLYISRISLRSLDFLIKANLTKLEFIQARRNTFSVINEEVWKSLPDLIYVDFQGNSFTCDCDNALFLKWTIENNQTQVSDAYNFECNYPPELKGTKLLDFDIQSCCVNMEFICFISTTCAIVLFMVVSFTYHFLRWQLAYAYYFFLALLFDAKNKNSRTPDQYDAFISYNTHDEPWVLKQLLPNLEGEQGWRLCLHHRDFEPGKTANFFFFRSEFEF